MPYSYGTNPASSASPMAAFTASRSVRAVFKNCLYPSQYA